MVSMRHLHLYRSSPLRMHVSLNSAADEHLAGGFSRYRAPTLIVVKVLSVMSTQFVNSGTNLGNTRHAALQGVKHPFGKAALSGSPTWYENCGFPDVLPNGNQVFGERSRS